MSDGNRGPSSPSQAPPDSEDTALRNVGESRSANAPANGRPAGGSQSNGAKKAPVRRTQQPQANQAPGRSQPNQHQPDQRPSQQASRPAPASANPIRGEQTRAQHGSADIYRPTPPPPGVRLADPNEARVPAPATQPIRRVGSPPDGSPTDPGQVVPRSSARPARTTSPTTQELAAIAAEAPKHKVGAARRTRKARLRLSRLDPWSVMKTAFLFSIAAGIVFVVAVYVVWTVVDSSGLFGSVNDMVASVISTPGDTTPFRVEEYLNTQKVMGVTALLACFDVVIITALSTLGSFLYNLAATMLGGLEITLAED